MSVVFLIPTDLRPFADGRSCIRRPPIEPVSRTIGRGQLRAVPLPPGS